MKPKIVQDILNVLTVLTDRNVEEVALQNVLNAKLANMICLKNCSFRQYENFKPSAVSYYAMNFMNSGAKKDFSIDCINNYFLGFVKDEIENKIQTLRSELENELGLLNEKKNKKEYDKLEKDLESIRTANFELENPNYSGLYAEAQQIKKLNFGGLCIRISELGDYLAEIVGGDASKKRLFNSLKTIFEGKIAPNIIQGDGNREVISNVPVQVIMYTDYENLFNPKIRDYYMKNLKTGMARRSFIYMPKEKNVKKNYPTSFLEKEAVICQANKISKRLFDIFNLIEPDSVYDFSNDAKNVLYDYQCKCIDMTNRSKEESILKIEREESFWKITKLAVIYSIIDNPSQKIVESKYVLMAIDFYKEIQEGLKLVMNNREETATDKFVQFFLDKQNQMVSKMELWNTGYVNKNKFSKWWQNEGYDCITQELWENYKIDFTSEKIGKTIYYKAVPTEVVVKSCEDTINVSVSAENSENPVKNYEFKELTIEELVAEIKMNRAFCAGKLKNGYRKDSNYLGEQNTVWLDIENSMSIEDAKKVFKDYWYVMYTTRNHGKKGTGDRFRVILKTQKNLPADINQYKKVMKHIIEDFKGDKACSNVSRYYYGNYDAEVFVNKGAYFDWTSYDFEDEIVVSKPQKVITSATICTPAEAKKEYGLNDDNLFTPYADKVLKMSEVYANHRDEGFTVVVGGLIKCVKAGAISHDRAIFWLKDKLNQHMTADFRPNAEKFLRRLEELKF